MKNFIVITILVIPGLAFSSTEPVSPPTAVNPEAQTTQAIQEVAAEAKVPAPEVTETSQSSAQAPLEAQLETLQMPGNVAPASVAEERLYSVQSRFSPLRSRSEVALGGAYAFRGNGFLTMSAVDLDYRFHFSDRWSLNLGGSYNFNSLSSSGQQLMDEEKHAPDVSYPRYKGHLLVGFNTFYGKIRTSMDSNAYFDQYIAIGPGMIWTDKGTTLSWNADVGLAFWLKRWGSLRVGVMNEFFQEKRLASTATAYHVIGHVDFGFMFGGGVE